MYNIDVPLGVREWGGGAARERRKVTNSRNESGDSPTDPAKLKGAI